MSDGTLMAIFTFEFCLLVLKQKPRLCTGDPSKMKKHQTFYLK